MMFQDQFGLVADYPVVVNCFSLPEFLDRISFAHQLTERFTALTVVFENRATAFCTIGEVANFTGTSVRPRAWAQASRRCPEMTSQVPCIRSGSHDKRNQYSVVTDAWQEVVDLGCGITVNRKAKVIWLELAGRKRDCSGGEQALGGHGHGWGILVLRGIVRRMPFPEQMIRDGEANRGSRGCP